MKKDMTRRGFVAGSAVAALGAAVALSGCGGNSDKAETKQDDAAASVDLTDWSAVEEAAKGTNVTFYGWGGDDNYTQYMRETVAQHMKETYDINFEWRTVTATSEAVTLVSDEKQAGTKAGEGTCDLVWIDSENFATMKNGNLLYGDIQSLVPNVKKYQNEDDEQHKYDAGTEIEGLEIPWDPGIDVFIHDTATTSWAPKNADEFKKWVQEYEGFITYPSADDTYGRRSIWMFIMAVCGGEWSKGLTETSTLEEVQERIQPAIDFMKEINPYLWNKGQTYPSTAADWKRMFANGEVGLCFDWTPYSVGACVADGTFPETAKSFIFEDGTLCGMGYLSIPYDAPNVPGALVTINELITPDLQFKMLEQTGYPYALDYEKLSDDEKKRADSIDTGIGSFTTAEVGEFKLHSILPSYLIEPINKIWWNEVAGK